MLLLPGLKPGSGEFIANVAALTADLLASVTYTDHLMACLQNLLKQQYFFVHNLQIWNYFCFHFLNYWSTSLSRLATFKNVDVVPINIRQKSFRNEFNLRITFQDDFIQLMTWK